ncbi:MAG: hypothetical protein J0H68_00220 [Sphingobacteriia bacterium]|nr:hypothetical protein [Sphingobacteriia bacterium]
MNIVLRIVLAIFSIATFLISGYAFAFIMLALLPTMVIYSIDKRTNKTASNTVGAFNIIGLMPYIIELLNSGLDASDKAQAMMSNMQIWIVIYGATSIGLVIIWVLPQISGNYFVYREQKKIEKYIEEQKKLFEEWGPNVGFKKEFFKIETDKNS